MEVTHLSHETTHAVIGGLAPEAFEVKANAEFFEMLSSTMYPNQKLAVAREVLCNSWDAHLMVGKADTPVEVTITDKEMSFRDFGPGISREKIIQIYCTYGGSTKTHDGVQTGGFGLGSKSPFAYSKHFTVVSCHAGKRTIYAASRGSAETEGRPDFRPMVADIPTTETGITVTIPLMSPHDKIAFERLVDDLTFLGGMNVKLNGKQLKRLDYSKAEFPFLLLSSDEIGKHHGNARGLYVRYGAVVYPVNTKDERICAHFGSNTYVARLAEHGCVVLVAPPNSLGVAPSRETLTYSERTQDTIIALLKKANEAVEAEKTALGEISYKIIFAEMLRNMRPFSLLAKAVRRYNEASDMCAFLYDIADRGRVHLSRNMPQSKASILRVTAEIALFSYSRSSSFLKKLLNEPSDKEVFDKIERFVRAVRPGWKKTINRILARVKNRRYHNDPEYLLNGGRVEVHLRAQSITRLIKRLSSFGVDAKPVRASWDRINETSVGDMAQRHLECVFSHGKLPKDKTLKTNQGGLTVIISPNQTALRACYNAHRGKGEINGDNIIAVRVFKKSNVDDLKAFLAKAGIRVLDATPFVVKRVAPVASANRHILVIEKKGIDDLHIAVREALSNEKPDCFCYGEVADGDFSPEGKKSLKSLQIPRSVRNWVVARGLKVELAQNAADARILRKANIPTVFDMIAAEITEIVKTPEGLGGVLIGAEVISEIVPERLASSISYLDRVETQKDEIPAKMACWRVVFETFDLPIKSVNAGEQLADVLRDCISSSNRLGGKYGSSVVPKLLDAIGKSAQPLFAKVVEVCSEPSINRALEAFNSYELRRTGTPMIVAVLRTILEQGVVQNALVKATTATTTTK